MNVQVEKCCQDFIQRLFSNPHWNFVIVLLLALIATFAHDIDALNDGVIVYLIFAILIMLILTGESIGFVMLVGAIFVLSYNNVTNKKQKHVNGNRA
jgi:hypothetical protein